MCRPIWGPRCVCTWSTGACADPFGGHGASAHCPLEYVQTHLGATVRLHMVHWSMCRSIWGPRRVCTLPTGVCADPFGGHGASAHGPLEHVQIHLGATARLHIAHWSMCRPIWGPRCVCTWSTGACADPFGGHGASAHCPLEYVQTHLGATVRLHMVHWSM